MAPGDHNVILAMDLDEAQNLIYTLEGPLSLTETASIGKIKNLERPNQILNCLYRPCTCTKDLKKTDFEDVFSSESLQSTPWRS
jgi:hypothetical protein